MTIEPIDPTADQSEDQPDDQQQDGPRAVLRDARGRLLKGTAPVPGVGRKHGSPHRKFTWDVKKICEQYNYNPIEGLIHTAATTENLTLKYKCDAELLKYCAPTLRSTEIKTEQTNQVVFTWASDPSTVPTINADGSPVVSYQPEPVYEQGKVLDEVYAALQHKAEDNEADDR